MDNIYHCKNGHELTEANQGSNGNQCRRDYTQRNLVKVRKWKRESHIRVRYGISSLDELSDILISQAGGCKICKRTDCTWGKGFNNTWHIDHKHGAEGYRAILCARCNIILGSLRDDPTLAQGFVEYIQTHG